MQFDMLPDIQAMVRSLGLDRLRRTLADTPPGVLWRCDWYFWHRILRKPWGQWPGRGDALPKTEDRMTPAPETERLARTLKALLKTSGPEECRTIDTLLSSGASLAEGQELAHRLFPAFASMPALKKMVYLEPAALDTLDNELKRRLIASARTMLGVD